MRIEQKMELKQKTGLEQGDNPEAGVMRKRTAARGKAEGLDAFFAGVLIFLAAFPCLLHAQDVQGVSSLTQAYQYTAAYKERVEEAVFERPLRKTPYMNPDRFKHAVDREAAPGISGIEQALTQHYIRQFSSPSGIAWLEGVMARGQPYIGFIKQRIEERKLPPELLYLPVIESGFVSTAKSSAGAVGMWQFMKNSIGPFDIRITELLDERMDFWKATEGALRKLEDNYRAFRNWHLALASYNAGMGAVNTVIKNSGISDYWTLSDRKKLKTETIHYVPKLLAVSYILSNPRRFGIENTWTDHVEWTRIPVGKSVDLEVLAEHAGVDKQELKAANQELLFNITPADSSYHLKVRAEDAEKIAAVLDRTDIKFVKYYFYTIRSGDTLSALSKHYGVSVKQIEAANPGVSAQTLRLGVQLRIPAFKDVGPYEKPKQAGLSFNGRYTVKKGDTLWSIARTHNISPEVLAEANNMKLNDTLSIGRNLKTPILK
ncbi:MAG: LysM peptidoglycan-binding domain-containing protein [Treponema sp.]|nr:LysM peptidoglycan-binding domain-containing protein [Treponema sp.]